MASFSADTEIPTKHQADSLSIRSIEKDGPKSLPAVANDAALVTARGNVISKDGVVYGAHESQSSLIGNIFADPEVREHYKQVYEDAQYECRHVFDPDATWSPEEE